MKCAAMIIFEILYSGVLLVSTFVLIVTLQFTFAFVKQNSPGGYAGLKPYIPVILPVLSILIGCFFSCHTRQIKFDGLWVPLGATVLVWFVYFYACFTYQADYSTYIDTLLGYEPGRIATSTMITFSALLKPLLSLQTAIYLGLSISGGAATTVVAKMIQLLRHKSKQ